MKVLISNVIVIADPSPELVEWCKKELVLDNPDFEKKERMGFWTGDTPRKLRLYSVDGNKIILPYGCKQKVFEFTSPEDDIEYKFFPATERVPYNADVPLYDYQKKALVMLSTCGGGILQSPAGSGKTQIGIALTSLLGRRTLWLVHTHDLLQQSKERAAQYMDKRLFGTITEGKVDIGEGITFATVQTMCKLDLLEYRNMWDVVIVDECHRAAGTPTTVTRYYKVLNALAAPYKYGLSATVHRSDGLIKATFALLGNIVYTVPDEEVKDRIMPVTICPVWTGRNHLNGCTNFDGTLNYAKLINSLCEDAHRNATIMSIMASDPDHPSLILSDRLDHLDCLKSLLPSDMAAQAVMISGKMQSKKGKAEREDAIEGMRTGKYKYLFATYALAKEGLDIPCLERLYMVTPQKDYAVVVQSIGRIARTCPGKAGPVCYDFVDGIGYLQRAFKERCRHYRKINCTIKGD